jgi:tRNA(Arg) A34 adenosine deaminase TadA
VWEQGRKALKEGEVPVGCVIVHRRGRKDDHDNDDDDVVIATGYNKTNERRDVAPH